MADKDWIDRQMGIRHIKFEFDPYNENSLKNYLNMRVHKKQKIADYAQGLWDAIEALCYLPNKEEIEKETK